MLKFSLIDKTWKSTDYGPCSVFFFKLTSASLKRDLRWDCRQFYEILFYLPRFRMSSQKSQKKLEVRISTYLMTFLFTYLLNFLYIFI